MKKIFYILLAVPVFLAGCSPIIYTNAPSQPAYDEQPQQVYADQPQTDQVFYDELSPYGQWIDYPDYGYVWQPNIDADFRPYATNGYWVYSDYGWAWVSNYSWGWAPFHYGNWFYDDSYGWLWEPGHQWAPAWVTWGQSGDYYGWAPVPPRERVDGNWRPRNEDWNFVPARNITRVNVNNYVVRNNVTVINNTTIINNTTNNYITNNRNTNTVIYNMGPRVNEVENIANIKIQQVKISGNARPGQSLTNNQLNVYRPVIKQDPRQGNYKPAPQKVITYRQNNDQNPNLQQNRQTPGRGNGQGINQNPNIRQGRQTNGQGNNQNPNPRMNRQDQRPGNGQGNNQNLNPEQNQPNQNNKPAMGQNPNVPLINRPETVIPNRQNQKPVNGQSNNQNPNLQQNQQYPGQGNGRGNSQNPNLRQNQPNPGQVNGQGNNQNPNLRQDQQNQRQPNNGQGNNQNPNQQQLKPTLIMQPRPNQQQTNPRPGTNKPNNEKDKKPQPPQKQPEPPVKKDTDKPQGN
ncbi:MAG TPA: DUF6600 domain-containing protein [Mucilaginibacter sp.]